MARSYCQYCGLARSLDVVGDRWNLLIVRELLAGPLRYRELIDGLPGIATNMLADRLRDLESAGVIERNVAGDANAIVYALTPWGAELRDPIESLIRWSTPLMVRGPAGDRFRPEWLVIALPALFSGRTYAGSASVGIAVDDVLINVHATNTGFDVKMDDGTELDAVLRADGAIVLGMASGVLPFDLVRELVEIEGDEQALRVVFEAPARG